MLELFSNRYRYLLVTFFLTFATGVSHAEDTEIYFSSGSSSGNSSAAILPNVLLILDTSGSMTASVYDGGVNIGTRIELMKEAMVDIINGVEDVNMGLMRFTNNDGGAIVYPIAGIDDPAADTVSEPDDTKRTLSYTVGSSSDDAEQELTGNTVTINDPVLNIDELSADDDEATAQINTSLNDAAQWGGNIYTDWRMYSHLNLINGLRFTGLNIPAGATITSATLFLTNRNGIDAQETGRVIGEEVSNCANYSGLGTNGISNRQAAAFTTASSTQTFGVFDPESMDITSVVQELYAVGAGQTGNALCLFYEEQVAANAASFHSFDTSAANAPYIVVKYTTPVAASDQTTGIRFQDVVVPQGATITDAKLILTPYGSDATAGEIIDIRAETVDDSTTFTTAVNDIGARPTTTNFTRWTLPATTDESPITSCIDGTCTGNSLAQVIQRVTDRAGWCGGNDLNLIIEKNNGNKNFYSYDGDLGLAAQLEVTYDATGTLGCVVDTDTAQIATGNDDAENSTRSSGDLDFESGVSVGLRFQDMNVPQGATIISATLNITAESSDSGSSTDITIYGEDEDDADSYGNVSTRTKTSASVLYEPPNWTSGTTYTTSDISTVVQEIVNRAGWADGNSMAFIMETTGSKRRGITYNTDPTKAARLSITYQSTGGFSPVKTVREKLVELVGELPTSDWTPITEVLYESAHYWRGESVVYGKSRDGLSATRLSHPGSYCEGDNDCGGANTATYPPYGINSPAGCTDANLDASACSSRSISGTPDYISPFSSELSCASNYQILLTDGEANSSNMESTIESEFSGVSCRSQDSNGDSLSTSERCSIDLAEYMNEEDQSSVLDNNQTVTTYTVGFNISNQFLVDIATEGGGTFSEATTASDLVTVFDSILTDVKSDPTSIVSPSLATNAFNRLLSRDSVYFGLFTPELNSAWDGNVKKYNICTEVGTPANCDFITRILDANNEQAVDIDNRFKTSATSVWSDVIDGIETTAGGVGGELTDYTDRVVYTDTTSSGIQPSNGTGLDDSGFKITSSNWTSSDLATVRTAVCPVPSTTASSDCEDRMLWMLGKVITEEETDVDDDTRWTVGDVLHSSPVTITYGGADSDADLINDVFYDKVIFGTNDGGLRMINADTGKEDWIFIPQSTIDMQQSLFVNPEGDHLSGIDLTPIVDINDVDKDGVVEPSDGDTVHAYFGMRRGGKFIYALDLTASLSSSSTPVEPKFLWRIEGGVASSDFQYLSDTWSQPQLTSILTTTGSQDVLIFGGGYDVTLDNGFGTTATSGNNNDGNMIFVVNPTNGSLIFSIGGSNTNATLKVPDMRFSMAAKATIIDTTGDGNDNRIYIADTGGQIWRVDLADDINISGSAGSTVVGRLASVSTDGTPEDERRFFEQPEIAAVLDTQFAEASNQKYFLVTIGSGNRAHPLDTAVHDRFYGIRDFTITDMTGGGGAAHLASNYPQTSGAPIDESLLVDISLNVLDEDDSATDASSGWYMDFYTTGHEGEKLLSPPIIIGGNVFFTTYEPDAGNNLDACAANLGGGRLLGFDIFSTRGFTTDSVDRTITNSIRGIASGVIPFYSTDGIYGLIGVEGGVWQPEDDEACEFGTTCDGGMKLDSNAANQTYWSEL
jgi:type IV pilus assembly protein PilY1